MAYSLFQTLNISRQDMLSRLLDLDVVSNNLSNMNTTGFKASRANFQELLAAQNRDGVTLVNTQMLTGQGSLRVTGSPLDWAIQGEGFLQVRLPDGSTGYTRDGAFLRDADGTLVNASGYPLAWDGEMPEGVTDVFILPDGTVQASLNDGSSRAVGQLELARFNNPTGLSSYGSNIWLETEASGEPQLGAPGSPNFGNLKARALEQSNVNLADEMAHMVTLQRAFEMSVRAFQQTDSMISQAIHMRKI